MTGAMVGEPMLDPTRPVTRDTILADMDREISERPSEPLEPGLVSLGSSRTTGATFAGSSESGGHSQVRG